MSVPKFLSVPEAAERLNLSRAMVRRYCQDGKIDAFKVNRDWLIPERAVTEFASRPRKVGRPPQKGEKNDS